MLWDIATLQDNTQLAWFWTFLKDPSKITDMSRVPHGYGNTRGVSQTGNTGTGTVVDFGTPRHTAYPYRGVTGIHGLIT